MVRPDPNLEALLREADDLMRQARGARKNHDYDVAESALHKAAGLLEPELHDREIHLGDTANVMGASEDRRALAVRLADCFGPLGGIARRRGDYRCAYKLYAKGRELELNEAYNIQSTYNRIQWIVAQILIDPASISNPDGTLATEANEILKLLSRSSDKDPWASADVLLLSSILKDRRRARGAWSDLVDARPIQDVYESGLPVLCELAGKLPDNDLLRDTIAKYRSKLKPESASKA
jgi:hypothetical protein